MANEKLLVFCVLVASVHIAYGRWYPAHPPIQRWISEAVKNYHEQHSHDSENEIASQNGIPDQPADVNRVAMDSPKYESHQRRTLFRGKQVAKHYQQVQHSGDSKNKVVTRNDIPDDVEIVDINGNVISLPKYQYDVGASRKVEQEPQVEIVDIDGNRLDTGNNAYESDQ